MGDATTASRVSNGVWKKKTSEQNTKIEQMMSAGEQTEDLQNTRKKEERSPRMRDRIEAEEGHKLSQDIYANNQQNRVYAKKSSG